MAKVKIEIHTWLARLLSSKEQKRNSYIVLEEEISEGDTIKNLLQNLAAREARLGEHLFDTKSGRLTDQISIALNNRFINLINGPDTRLNDGDIIVLFQAWSGG